MGQSSHSWDTWWFSEYGKPDVDCLPRSYFSEFSNGNDLVMDHTYDEDQDYPYMK